MHIISINAIKFIQVSKHLLEYGFERTNEQSESINGGYLGFSF